MSTSESIKPLNQAIPFRNQLRTRLVFSSVALVVVSIAVVTGFTLYQVYQQSQQQNFNQLESVAQLKENQIKHWLDGANEQLSSIYSELIVGGGVPAFLKADNRQAPQAASLASQLQHTFDTLAQENDSSTQTLNETFIYDLHGSVVASSEPSAIGKVVTIQPYFQPSLTASYIQTPYYAIGSYQLNMVITHPILDDFGAIVGVVAGRLNLNLLGSIMAERAGLGDTGETYLVSIENNYLLTPSRLPGYSLTRSYRSEGIDNALNKQNGSGIYSNYEDTPVTVLGVYHWIPELNTALLAEINVAEAQTLVTRSAALIVGLVIVLGLIAAAIGSVAATGVSRPITQLTQAAAKIASGDRSQRVTVRSRDEIGALALAFNQMTDQLTSNIAELDTRNEELQIATARAKEAARVKGEFLANVSHELRTPLNAIIGFSDMLLMGMSGELNTKQRHKMERLKENGVRLLNLINDILDITRIEARRVEIVNKPFSPHTLTERLSAQMAVLAERSALTFIASADPDLPDPIIGDEQRIEQIVVNLLSNAFKFTEAGSVSLDVWLATDQWGIKVVDTGRGIPPHALNFIFEEFRQVDGGFARAYKGSGLGLAITRNLVRLMDGEITVESELGKGSAFTVTLPLLVEKSMNKVVEHAGA